MELPRHFWRRTYLTIVGAIITAVAVLAVISQLTGFSAYTGDELESHRAQRIQQELERRQRELEDARRGEGVQRGTPPATYDECIDQGGNESSCAGYRR